MIEQNSRLRNRAYFTDRCYCTLNVNGPVSNVSFHLEKNIYGLREKGKCIKYHYMQRRMYIIYPIFFLFVYVPLL